MINEKIIIDFTGAAHGHFLEYVINSWIGQGHRLDKIFTDLGTCHLPNKNSEYMADRLVVCGHYSEHNKVIPTPDKIVRITINDTFGFSVYRVNLLYRPGDIGFETSVKHMNVADSVAERRKNIYSKLIDIESKFDPKITWKWLEVPCFEFPMEHLYDQVQFYQTLSKCAKFLNQRFIPDADLANKWHKFMNLNQGTNAYFKSKSIVEDALSQKPRQIETNEVEQALINFMLSETLEMYDGPLFTDEQYPTSTMEIWSHISNHLNSFDSRF